MIYFSVGCAFDVYTVQHILQFKKQLNNVVCSFKLHIILNALKPLRYNRRFAFVYSYKLHTFTKSCLTGCKYMR